MRILLVIDMKDWILHDIAKEISKNIPEHDFDILVGHESSRDEFLEKEKEYDLVHFIAWPFITIWDVKPKNAIMSVCSWRHWFQFGIKEAIKRVKKVVCISRSLSIKLKGDYIPDGIDLDLFRKDFIVGFVGRPDEYKGFPMVEKACSELGLELRVANNMPKHAMPAFYNSVDIVVLGSEKEGYSAVILECLAMNRPVVTTAEGDFKDKNITLVKRDTESIKDGIKRFYTRPSIKKRTWKLISKQYKELYENL